MAKLSVIINSDIYNGRIGGISYVTLYGNLRRLKTLDSEISIVDDIAENARNRTRPFSASGIEDEAGCCACGCGAAVDRSSAHSCWQCRSPMLAMCVVRQTGEERYGSKGYKCGPQPSHSSSP